MAFIAKVPRGASALEHPIAKMFSWDSQWGLPINLNKCSFLHVGDCNSPGYCINGAEFRRCQVGKDLGVLVDSKLTFSCHIDAVIKSAYAILFTIFRNVHCSNRFLLIKLYKAYVLPHLECCCQVWNPTKKKDIAKTEKVQHTFTRLVSHWGLLSTANHRISANKDCIKTLGIRTLGYRRIFTI